MSEELSKLALDLKDFLVKYQRVTNIRGPQPLSPNWRSWELYFTHRGMQRHYIYRVERQDPMTTMYQALRADTTGELLVRIPGEQLSSLMTNVIYYPPHG